MTVKAENDCGEGGADDGRAVLELICSESRAPLEGILAVAERLSRQPMPPDAQACVRTITDTAEALLRRFDQALQFAAGRAGRLEITPDLVQPRALIDDIQAQWQARAGRGVTLLAAYDGDPDMACLVDAARLKQLFDCLVGAALRVTARGAVEASLRARAVAGRVWLEGRVRDAGPPLSEGEFARLFDTASPRTGAAGLSLPLSRELVRAMGGEIRAERNAGAGVTIVFELDAAVQASAPQETTRADTVAHVLVVDDNATNRMVAQSLCEMFDCTCEAVEDGLEALDAARTGRFDVILMDIKMPRMDGIAATRAIRKLNGPAGRVPVIALTANAGPEDVRAYLACGMSSVVEKPINPERLLLAMNAAFEQPPAEAKTRAA